MVSEDFKANIIGYHVNDKERCMKFVNNDKYLITSEDKYWLGFGMYFWDNYSNVEYWHRRKKKHNPDLTYIKVRANIYINEELLLDLSDEIVVERLEFLWKLYCEKNKENRDQPLGIKIDKLFNFFDDMLKRIKIIRGIGNYNNEVKRENPFIEFSKQKEGLPKVDSNLKIIYCTRTYDVVVNRRICERS